MTFWGALAMALTAGIGKLWRSPTGAVSSGGLPALPLGRLAVPFSGRVGSGALPLQACDGFGFGLLALAFLPLHVLPGAVAALPHAVLIERGGVLVQGPHPPGKNGRDRGHHHDIRIEQREDGAGAKQHDEKLDPLLDAFCFTVEV